MALDGTLMFGTGVDNSGFNKGINTLQVAAGTALGNIASEITGKLSELAASIPAEMVSIGSGFEASMSQVAATMGITSAAAEFDTLSDAAKEMGETTKFSASQAGEALNYLALAGYDAEKAVSALPTVLNVAAAGGMELAAASDMITDAMSALGLQTSQMADFSDKLAVTAQKSNTSISQLGEAILTVGGTAKSLAGGVTEMNTVLGILADNGIKGAEGGTMLRNVILSLSAPTSTAAAALKDLGVTAFDASGSMRPLEDTFADLNAALSKLSDQEKTAVLNEIFNKVDLKGVNALLGTSAERFDELSGYIDSCSGAAADMAATMDDNLKGDLTIMQSALEGLGIAAYEKFQTPMRTAVQSVTEDIGTLSASISDGALSESFDNIASKFAGLVSSISSFLSESALPSLINGVSWLVDNFGSFIPVLSAATAAVISYKVAVIAAETATKALSAVHSGMILTFVTNPIYLTITAVTLLTAAVAAYIVQINKVSDAYKEGAHTYSEQIDTLGKLEKSYDEVRKSAQKKIDTEEESTDKLSALKKELDDNIDANGNIIGDYKIVKSLIEEINKIYPDTIELIDGQIRGYDRLSSSIDSYISNLKKQTLLDAKKEVWSEAVVIYDETSSKNDELLQKTLAADEPYMEALRKYQKYKNGVNDYTKADYEAANAAGMKVGEYLYSQYEYYRGVWESSWQAYNENKNLMDKASSDISAYEDALKDNSIGNFSYLADYYRRQGEQAYNAQREATEKLALSQEEATEKLMQGWKAAEHNYAIGVIGSQEELYSEKQRLWNEYGSEDLEEHWQYYEDLIGYQQDYAKQSADEYRRELDDRFNAVEHRLNLGLISEEDAYKAKLDLIRQYCPEYSDEWYGYYKDVYDYQQEYADKQLDELKNSIRDQIDAVKSGLKDILSEYNSKYKDIQSNIDSFRNKLLSLGEAFSVIENKDGSKRLKVNNLAEPMEEMRKYTAYIKNLKAEGASRGLIEELTSMDAADGMEFAKNLANMSDADFAQINDYYRQRDELAKELAENLYAPDVSALNEKLVNDITEQFGMLPEEIQALGAESLNAFIAGLGSGDFSEQVESFIDSFGTELDNGLDALFENLDEDIAKSIGDNVYEVGKTSGEDFVKGFNEALAGLEAAFLSEQSRITAEYSVSGSVGAVSQSSGDNKPIKIENKIDLTIDVDGDKMAQKTITYTNEVNQRSGK